MKVTLVSHPIVAPEFYDRLKGTEMGEREQSLGSPYVDDADLVPEAAGRVCYDSFDLPNPATRDNADYLANIRRQLHFSVLEHSNFTFHVAEVSRALLAEITRHRHLSFSVRSQRYCWEGDSQMVIPSALLGDDARDLQVRILKLQGEAKELYGDVVGHLMANGFKRKEAHDAARYVLPEGTHTEFYVTGNGRAWLEFLAKRDSPHAAQEIRELAGLIKWELCQVAPGMFTSD